MQNNSFLNNKNVFFEDDFSELFNFDLCLDSTPNNSTYTNDTSNNSNNFFINQNISDINSILFQPVFPELSETISVNPPPISSTSVLPSPPLTCSLDTFDSFSSPFLGSFDILDSSVVNSSSTFNTNPNRYPTSPLVTPQLFPSLSALPELPQYPMSILEINNLVGSSLVTSNFSPPVVPDVPIPDTVLPTTPIKNEVKIPKKSGKEKVLMHRCEHPGCGKLFNRKHNLKVHILTHDKNRKKDFICEHVLSDNKVCKKSFARVH
ncbi:hypothetical protein HDU92_008330, partial [Lobulomyces angularis]